MRCQLVRDYRFEAAHRLPCVPATHKCSRVHGHSYQISITVEGEVDAESGWLVDFAAIDDRVRPVIDRLDHQFLNEIPGLSNPTCELLAQWMWNRLKPELPLLCELSVSETPTSRCIYRGE